MDRRRFLPTYHYEDNTGGLLKDSAGKPLRDYKIYGNSKQSGTPTPETPVEIVSVGDKTEDGRYKVPINVIGKNILNEEKLVKDFNANAVGEAYKVKYETVEGITGFKLYGSTGYKVTQYCPFRENKQYTISFKYYDECVNNKVGSTVFIFYTDGTRGEVLLGGDRQSINRMWRELSFTSIANKTVSYIYFSYSSGVSYTYFADFQVEEGNAVTTYEPYKDLGTTNIYLAEPLRKAGEYTDYVDFVNKCVVRNTTQYEDGFIDGLLEPEIEPIELPKIPTAKGIVNIMVDTDVQPSGAIWQYYRK